ncbi:DUF1062 domain-containing protein [Shinella sp.]|uniref:DUF1062 domain-containing protein n=1 Tax=Shinella sp. TaxID=1870904 RepID=UPI0028A7D3D2|nr:DUF1062 domain-containing protein [Shinella sp.]
MNFLSEDQDDMQNTLTVRWTVIPVHAPQPVLACSTCASPRPFRSSDRLRLNANGKKLDAWLIYKCTQCDKTWNRPLFERRNIREIDPATLQALQSSDAQWARRHAFDLDALRRKTSRIEVFPECVVEKTMLGACAGEGNLEIVFSVPLPSQLRLDRLLASELAISRSRLQTLDVAGALHVQPTSKDALRRPVSHGSAVHIAVETLPDRDALMLAACGANTG